MKKKVDSGTARAALRILKPYLKRYAVIFVLVLLLATVSVALSLYLPILIGDAINEMVDVGKVNFEAILEILLVMGACIGVSALAQWQIGVLNQWAAQAIVRDIREDAFARLTRLPVSYLDSHSAGDVVSRLIADADALSSGLLLGFTQLFTGFFTILGTLAFLVYLNVWIALAVVVLTPISLLVARTIANNTYAMFSRQSRTRGEQTAFIDEMIDGCRVVQAFGHEEEVLADFKEVNDRLRKVSFRATFYSSLTNPSTRAVNNVVYAVVALLGGLQLLYPTTLPIFVAFGVGELTACLSYANQYTKPFNEISGVFAELQNAFACTTRIGEILAAEPETPDSPTAITLTDAKGDVTLRAVAFSYDKSRSLLEDVNVEVSAGKRIAIVGPTGCGKTTLINLLMRFYDVDAGEILVDGTPIGEITRHSLRTSFGMVLQDSWIRDASVRDNITLGRDFTDEEVIAAAKRAHAHSFIRRLPEGYNTILAGDGSLSQGQKQLISIARVMLLSPPILILDEATSSIDTHTERKIQDAFVTLMEGRTSFIVAHRLSTVRSADCILVMQDGKIVESGKHEALLAKGGLYATIYNSQFEP